MNQIVLIWGACIANLVLAGLIASILMCNRDLLKVLAIGLFLFYIEYVFCAAILLYMERFDVRYCMCMMLIVNVAAGFAFRRRCVVRDWGAKLYVNWKELFLVFLLLAIALLASSKKSENIDAASDYGAYFNKAASLIQEDTSHIRELKEYGTISNSVDRGLTKLQSRLYALNHLAQDGAGTGYYFEYHSLPVWPAVLALFMALFGVFNGGIALSFLLIIATLGGYLFLKNSRRDSYGAYIIFPLFSFMPLIDYLSKTLLSEMAFLAMLMPAIYFLTENQVKYAKAFSSLAFGLLGYLHISTFLYMPFIAVLFFVATIITRRSCYAIMSIFIVSLYLPSFEFAHKLSEIYFRDIISYTIGKKTFPLLIVCFGLSILLNIVAIYMLKKNKGEKISQFVSAICTKNIIHVLRFGFIVVAVATVVQGYLLAFTDYYVPEGINVGSSWSNRINYANKGFSSLNRLNLVSMLMATGYACIPFLMLKLFAKKRRMENLDIAFYFMLLATFLIYTIIRPDTPSNYLTSRYFSIALVPVAIFLTGRLAKSKKCVLAIATVALLTGLPFTGAMFFMRGSGGVVEIYEDTTSVVEKGAIVLIDADNPLDRYLVNNLRQLNDNLVYETGNAAEVIEYYGDQGCYSILTNDAEPIPADLQSSYVKSLMLKKPYTYCGPIDHAFVPYPLTQSSNRLELYIYRITGERLNYALNGNEDFKMSGFMGSDGTYRWSEANASLIATLNGKRDYYMTLRLGWIPPVSRLNRNLDFSLYINGQQVGDFSITQDTTETTFDMYVDSGILNDGLSENTITIVSDVWQPSEYGSKDERYLGLPVAAIDFEKA